MVISAPKGTGALLGRVSNLSFLVCLADVQTWFFPFKTALFADNEVPIEIKDRLGAAQPLLISKRLHQIGMKRVKEVDRCVFLSRDAIFYAFFQYPPPGIRELHEGLEKAGFKLDWGIDGSGWLFLATLRLGGYYLGNLNFCSKLHSDRKLMT